ncbi:hypothetical protein AVEN_215842-1 [Araneus ventricosus]|uniref:Uncharacterized protein n=1 Tax=Araneus ventricosus TaxID=182803 RepID=A0A4Y2VDI3_ARAVE|nr:hypothetical protein AVEN_215842-1 [Araneus ventricosus]
MKDQFNASTLLNSLKSDFKGQPHLTFRIIHSALRNIREVHPKALAIILLLATNGSETVCSEFAHRLVDSLSVPKYTVKISGKNYRQANTNLAKMEIDKVISNSFLMTNWVQF